MNKLARKPAAAGVEPMQIKFTNLDHPITVRPGTDDATTVISTVVREEYGQLQLTGDPLVMIDAGAYIGDTSAYFLSRFKGLRIFALEPSASWIRIRR